MTTKGLAVLSYGLLFLTIGAAAALAVGDWSNQVRQARGREFQQLVGGLGTGVVGLQPLRRGEWRLNCGNWPDILR